MMEEPDNATPPEAPEGGIVSIDGSPSSHADARKEAHGERERVKGIFSTQSIKKIGTGATVRRTIEKSFWMVDELEDGAIEIQPLNANYIPSGPKRQIDMDYLLDQFSPEPEFYVHTVFPAMQELSRMISKGEAHRKKGELFSAEHQFSSAIKVDVENVRANFGLGLTYLERGETPKADNIFSRLVKLDAAFEPEHKHLFNDFGISLRRNKMYDQALTYYQRAMDLTKGDEHLVYNIARAFFEKSDVEMAVSYLKDALRLNPDLEPAKKFLDWLREKGLISAEDQAKAVASAGAPQGEPAEAAAPDQERPETAGEPT